jgi:hypothetical protein
MLNYCRLFHGATTVSDIATADGKEIDRTMFLGTPSLFASQTKWMQAEQAKPYTASWVQWLLFDHLDMSLSPYDILASLDSNNTIYSASDGLVKHHQGSFGWLLSSPNGAVILQCSGPAYGKQMKSY